MSLRSPRNQGFQALPNNNMNYESDSIPLGNVQARSNSTGARKPSHEIYQAPTNHTTFKDEEKKGMFKGRGGKRKLRKLNSKNRIGTDGEEVKVNGLGRLYNKVVNFSIITRYLVYVFPVALLIAAPIIVFAILNHEAIFASTGVKVIYFWTWIEIVWLSIWVSKLVAQVIPWVFMFLCGVVSSGTRKYAKILKEVEIPLSLVGWAVTSLVTFTALTSVELNKTKTNPGPGRWVTVVKNLLAPALITSLIFLVEKLAIQLVSINYHRRSFEQRIRESKHNVDLIGHLYDASRALFPMYCHEFAEEDYIINDSIEALAAKSFGHKRSGSATPLKLIADVGRFGDKVTSVFGNIASEITGKQVFNPNSAHSIVVEALEKTKPSEALAKRLWFSFVIEGKDALYAEDIEEVLGPHRKSEAEDAFAVFDSDGNGDVSLDEMITKVVEIGRDRKSIAASMRDVGQAIGVLDQVVCLVLFLIVIFVFVAFQDANFVTTLATAGTTLLSLSFVFAASVQEFLGSCIFLFVKHPYDVGDRVDITGPEKENLVVEQISLLYTIFKRIDTMKMVQVPNIVLNNLWVENVTRSKAMKEQLDMFISFDTTLEDIELLRTEMEAFVRHPDNSRDFQPDIILEATGIGNMDKLQLKVEIRHKSNWHNETIRAARRSKFMCALVLALRKVPIYAPGGGGEPLGGPTNPGYSVAIDDTWATEAREKAKEAKEGKRAVPTKKAEPASNSSGADLGPPSEEKAAENLNARRPAADAADHDDIRDDQTLGSRDESLELRSNDIDNLRQGLLKRESTRGRRKPGVSVPPMPGQPGFSVTRPNDEYPADSPLDEEAELGLYQSPTNHPLTSSPYYGAGTATQVQPGYSIYPPPSQGSRGAQQQAQQVQYAAYPGQSSVQQAQPEQAQAQQVTSSQSKLQRLSLGFKPSGNGQGGAGAS